MYATTFENDLDLSMGGCCGVKCGEDTSSASSWLFMLLDRLVSWSPTSFSEWKLASAASL